MSIYNPPSKTQSVFNPSNFGGLGTGGQITTDYLDANYIQFPVSQGNATLVGTSVLGDITQQGDFYTTGDLLVNDVNIITEIDAKQTATTNTIIVNVGDNLKDTINNMGVNDTIKVSGGTFTDNISISTNSGTRTQGNVVGEKNKTILNGNLTIRSGVLFSLTNFKIAGNTYVNNNTIFLPFESINQSFTNCEFKMIELRGGNQTVTFTDCKINNSFRSFNASITGIINFIRCDFTGSSFNLLHPPNKNAIVMTDCIGLPDDVSLDTQNYTVKGITGYTTKLGAFLSHSYTANETPTLTNELSSKYYVDSQVGTKQPTIEDGDLTIANTSGLQTALNDKQDTIEDGDLTIAKTSGLQTALDNKQDEITTDAELTLNSITTTDLVVNESLNIDNVITYEKYKQFNSIVIRKQDETDFETINLNEIQCWVGGVNIMVLDTNTLTSYFANWTEKDTPLGAQRATNNMYNNIIEIDPDFGTHSGGSSTNALIIKDIPPTFINDIQAVVLYNRSNSSQRAQGLIIELYNTDDDPSLIEPLSTTNPISTTRIIYRFDFPAIDTYPAGDFTDSNYITNIISETSAETEHAIINDIDTYINISGNASITGDLVVGTTNIISEIGTKQDEITTTTDLTSNSITTIGSGTIGGNLTITGKLTNLNQPAFKAVSGISSQVPAGTPIKYNTEIIDNDNAHITSTGEYTIRKAGNWFFYYSFQSNGVAFNVQLQQNGVIRDQVSTDTTPTINTDLGCKGMAIIPCVVNDVIRVFVFSGSVRVENADEYHSFGGYLIG